MIHFIIGFVIGFYIAIMFGLMKIANMDADIDPMFNTPEVTRKRYLVALLWPLFYIAAKMGKYHG